MVTSGWGVWALSPCGLVLVICLSMCLSEEPHIKPADCSRKEHPVVSYQGEQRNTPLIEWGGGPRMKLGLKNEGTLAKSGTLYILITLV